MRSEILAQELKEKREKKRLERRRQLNRKHQRAWYKRQKLQKRQQEAAVPKHPTLSDAEIAAVEEVAGLNGGLQAAKLDTTSPTAPAAARSQAPIMDAGKKPAPDCLATLEEFEQRTTAHLKELEVLKYGPTGPEPKPRIPPPFALPNGIIL